MPGLNRAAPGACPCLLDWYDWLMAACLSPCSMAAVVSVRGWIEAKEKGSDTGGARYCAMDGLYCVEAVASCLARAPAWGIM